MKLGLFHLRSSLQTRFMVSVGTLLILVMGITIVAVNARLASLLFRETRAKGHAIAHSLGATTSNALLNYDYVALNQVAERAVHESGIAYVIILDKENNVAAQSERPDLVGMATDGPIGKAAAAAREPMLQNTEIEVGGARIRVLDVAHPVYVEGSAVKWGTVRMGLDLESMHREVRRIQWLLLAIGLGGVGLALVGARIISRRITRSIDDLARGTIAVAQGNLDHRIEIDSGDEIATLAEHFNRMTAHVKRQQDEIAIAKGEMEVLNATLEEKVATRTREFLASEEKYRILVENSPDPILIHQGRTIRFVNPAFEKVFGYQFGGMVRDELAVENLFHPEDRSRALDFLHRVLMNEAVETGEIRGVTKGGDVRIFELRGMRINYLGEPAVEIILLDTTEKKELQDHLLQHEKLRALGELASGVAHDFNNILGIILGRSQLLQQRVDDLEVRRGLRTIERAAYDGGETVRRIQEFARSRTERNFETVDVNVLLEEVVEITRTRWKDQAEVRNVKIDVRMDLSNISTIRGNASELREVYTNLIFNSVDAMPAGGTIHIRSFSDAGDTVVEVRDTGRGMDEHVKARIFDPFFTTKGTKGLGMGMSVVYGIVERHNGRIALESEPGKGACFSIRVPEASGNPRVEPPDETETGDPGARILVIDDEEDILELVSDILRENGHVVRTATSGPKGLAIFDEQEFDLLFCDLGMREMSGWEVVSAIRSRDAEIAVVLLTGWGATLSGEKVGEYGIDAVLNKPFQMKKLLATVGDILERRDRKGATT